MSAYKFTPQESLTLIQGPRNKAWIESPGAARAMGSGARVCWGRSGWERWHDAVVVRSEALRRRMGECGMGARKEVGDRRDVSVKKGLRRSETGIVWNERSDS